MNLLVFNLRGYHSTDKTAVLLGQAAYVGTLLTANTKRSTNSLAGFEIHLSPEIVFRKCRQCYSVITYFFSPNNNTNDQKRKRNKTKVQLSNKIFGCYDKITLTKLILYLSPADKSSEQ